LRLPYVVSIDFWQYKVEDKWNPLLSKGKKRKKNKTDPTFVNNNLWSIIAVFL